MSGRWPGPLIPADRAIVREELLFWHQKKWFVYALTVKPSHVPVMALSLPADPGAWYSLSEILHSVKRRSSGRINKRRERRGALWEGENYDHIIRDDREFLDTLHYLMENAAVETPDGEPYSYDGFWCAGLEDGDPGAAGPVLPVSGVGRRVRADEFVKRYRVLPHWESPGARYHIVFCLLGHRPAESEDWPYLRVL